MDPAVITLLVGLVDALPTLASGIMSALAPDVRAAVRDQIAHARTRLAAAPLASTGVDAVIARHHPQVTHATADALDRMRSPRSGALLTSEERTALEVASTVVRAVADAREETP